MCGTKQSINVFMLFESLERCKNWEDLQHESQLEKENKNVRNVNSLLEIEKHMTLENATRN